MQPSVSQAKINANRLNAQKSTGPRTPEGRTKSAANSTRHGLQASPATIFENNPTEQTQFEALHAKLFHQCLPTGDLEVQAFERYAFATFQSQRARKMETSTQDRWLNEPTNQIFFLQMERFTKLSALQERRADRALNELRKLQSDRVTGLDIHNELFVLEKQVDFPASLPVTQMRTSNLYNTSPSMLSLMVLSTSKEVQAILSGQTKPPVHPRVTMADLNTLTQRQTNK